MAFTPSDYGQGMLLTGLTPGSSLTGFTAVITKDNLPTSALDTGATSCLNGGGDWVFSTDSGGVNQLPCEIVTCVTSATPASTEFIAWIRFPTYASGTREVYAFWNRAGQSQPAVGAAFGRNEVWVDYEASINTDGSATDSTGNYTPTSSGAVFTSGGILGSYATLDSDATDNIKVALSGTVTYPLTFGSWARINTTERTRIVSLADASETNEQINIGTDTSNANQLDLVLQTLSSMGSEVEQANTSTDQTDWCYYVAVLTSSTDRKLYFNGGLELSGVDDLTPSGIDTFSVGITGDSTPFGFQPIDVSRPFLKTSASVADQISIEYDNQSDPATFWTAGTPFVPSVSTITVNGITPNYTYASVAGSIDLTGLISVTGSTPNYAYSPISGTIDLTPTISVTGATPNYTYSAIAGTVETPGIISITGLTPNLTYAAVAGTVTLQGTITVTGETPNYTYASVRGIVTDGLTVYSNSFVGFVPDQGVFSGVVKSATFSGIISETSDFSGYAKATTFLGVKQ